MNGLTAVDWLAFRLLGSTELEADILSGTIVNCALEILGEITPEPAYRKLKMAS